MIIRNERFNHTFFPAILMFFFIVSLYSDARSQPPRTLEGHTEAVYSVAFSPDGKMLASSSRYDSIKLWDTTTGEELPMLPQFNSPVYSIAFSPNGKMIASGNGDNTITIWNVATRGELQKLSGAPVYSIAFSSDNRIMIASDGKANRIFKMWDISTGKELLTLTSGIYEEFLKKNSRNRYDRYQSLDKLVAFSFDEKLLAGVMSGYEGGFKLWKVATGEELFTRDDSVTEAIFSPDGRMLALIDGDDTVNVVNTSNGKSLWNPEENNSRTKTLLGSVLKKQSKTNSQPKADSIVFSPDGKTLAGIVNKNVIKLWNAQTGREIKTLDTKHTGSILELAFSADGKMLATAGSDKTVKLWNVQTDEAVNLGKYSSKTASLRKLAQFYLKNNNLNKAWLALEMAKKEEYFEYWGRTSRSNRSFNQNRENFYFQNISYRADDCEKDYKTLSDELTALAAEANALKNKVRNSLEEKRLAEISTELNCLGEAYHKVLSDIFAKAANSEDEILKYYQIPRLRTFMADLRELSSPTEQTVVLYTLTMSDEYWILLVAPDVILAKSKPLKSRDLAQKVAGFRGALQNRALDPKPLAQELYQDMLETVAVDLGRLNAKTLVWSLDRGLRYLPVAALHDGNQYLVEKYRQVIYTPAAPSRWKDNVPSNLGGIGFGVSDGQPPLPGVMEELVGIFGQRSNGILKGRFYANQEFTEKILRIEVNRALPNGYLGLHIASHFFLIPGEYSKRDSYLLLGNNEKLSIEKMDKYLNLFEGVHLLTLSACDTAYTENAGNGVEFESFGVLAQEQGAKSVLATLWKVNDLSTSRLMQNFYEKWQTPPTFAKVEALRQSQIALMNGKYKEAESKRKRGIEPVNPNGGKTNLPDFKKDENAPYEHPYYWSPFVLIGNWR